MSAESYLKSVLAAGEVVPPLTERETALIGLARIDAQMAHLRDLRAVAHAIGESVPSPDTVRVLRMIRDLCGKVVK